ncbi:RagB/SusD family nutrient uptake outer membrane protein [Sphingobacterium multivorum]|uniref:RagB/SusD family nutrient uptake outer membrane protein n=1 Tax=Sphingobacterium TaxID=28453 RepID=UPI000963F69A|nr:MULTISPECIES: RagB/SusD family nutrient uptake outer membrane protein [Sphingobacterium]OJZ00118.1 MAG: RagB/SusD family nutrient uptake outer membrane protein [Sphingobacterium sp. 40-24]QQT46854.1 RagB/SusD family nutrient uptake outer membrane protein [Sphingobacterium multivorum]QQT60607.1 RagB/SusD family nutrient uptake outer membrane protein [Sphingobacterium multivorum]SUJ88881.1 SusD family [Sphingobacterium multivorum]
MKKYFKVIFITGVLWSTASLLSCNKYLDKEEQSNVSSKEAFKNFINFQGYTEELYNCVVNFSNNYWTNSWNWGEDEITSTANNFHYVNKIDQGNFWGWQREFDGWGAGWMDQGDFTTRNDDVFANRAFRDLWSASWFGLRKISLGLENIDKLTEATQEERNLIKGQLLFFRGWFHHRLMEYFGGMPYINYVLPSDEKLRLPRLSYQACADLAAADFREAANLLPIDWDNTTAGKRTLGKNQLRINKIMALAYLGKNYLWAGSPLMNFQSTGSKTYQADYCKKAAQAFGELLSLVESGQTNYALVPLANIHLNFYTTGQNWAMPGSTEAIFRGPYIDAWVSNWGTSKQYIPLEVGDGDLKFNPTANYVDYYGMKSGLPIKDITQSDAESGYNAEYPWKDRDPRFYKDIIFDGTKVVQGNMSASEEKNRYANLFTGGSYRDTRTGSQTGYVLRKFIPLTSNKYDQAYSYGTNLHIYVPYMRLADVYLMYAESALMASNSATGKADNYGKTAVDAINIVRDRAGVGHVDSKFLNSAAALLPELRRERAVELAFEGHRFNDLRRWLLLTEAPYTLKKAVSFDRAGIFNNQDPSQNRVVNIQENVILERKFTSKHYWLPLKVRDVNMYPEFYQNPGW